MKKRDLESKLRQLGYRFLRSKKHDLFTNGIKIVTVPRHKEINIFLAEKILKQAINESL